MLTRQNVNPGQFGRLFSRKIEGHIYSQVLYIHDTPVQIRGTASNKMRWELRNVMFVATMRNVVYAFDADDPSAADPLWKLDLGTPVPVADRIFGQKCVDIYNQGEYRDIFGWVGIVSTPVIDRMRHALFLVALHALDGYTPTDPKLQHFLYHIDIRNGNIVKKTAITATVKGSGAGNVGGRVTLNPRTQLQRASLALSPDGRFVYLGFGAYCDTMPYHGWVLMYDTETLEQRNVWCSSPNEAGGSVWNSGEALTVYPSGKLLISTSNTPFEPIQEVYDDYSIAKHSYPIGLVRLDPHKVNPETGMMNVDSFYIPGDDMEVGLMGTAVIELKDGTQVTTIGGKNGMLWLVTVNENKPLPGHYGRPIQMIKYRKHLHGSPVHWLDQSGKDHLYIWPMYEPLKHYLFDDRTHDLGSLNEHSRNASFPGGFLSISGKKGDDTSVIIWANAPRDDADMDSSAIHNIVQGVLIAHDPTDVRRVLWSSDNGTPEDQVGEYCKFNRPVVTAGRVYLPALSNAPFLDGYVHAFGIESPTLVEPPLAYDPEKEPEAIDAITDLMGSEKQRQEGTWMRLRGVVTGKGPIQCSWYASKDGGSSVIIGNSCNVEVELAAVRRDLQIDPSSARQNVKLWIEAKNSAGSIKSNSFTVDLNNLQAPPSMTIIEGGPGGGGDRDGDGSGNNGGGANASVSPQPGLATKILGVCLAIVLAMA